MLILFLIITEIKSQSMKPGESQSMKPGESQSMKPGESQYMITKHSDTTNVNIIPYNDRDKESSESQERVNIF